MGILVDGKWRDEELPQETGAIGDFRRSDSVFRNFITADGASGFKAEAGRYHLYVAYGCPWAHRTLIYRALKKLDGAISVAYAMPGIKDQGWTFEKSRQFPDCLPDPVNGFHYLHEAYTRERAALHRQGHGADPVGQEDAAHRQQRILRDHPHAEFANSGHRRRRHGFLSQRLCAPRSTASTI